MLENVWSFQHCIISMFRFFSIPDQFYSISAVCSPIAFLANSWLALAVEDSGNRGFFCGMLIQVLSICLSFHPLYPPIV